MKSRPQGLPSSGQAGMMEKVKKVVSGEWSDQFDPSLSPPHSYGEAGALRMTKPVSHDLMRSGRHIQIV